MDRETINNRLLFAFPERKAEVGVVFGAKSISGEVARHTAQLYHRGAFENIVLTGGNSVRQPWVLGALSLNFLGAMSPRLIMPPVSDFLAKQPEAHYMRDVLLKHDVPEAAITHIDKNSTNTGENVENVKAALNGVKSVALVTVAYGQRRAIGTMRFHPELEDIKLVSYPVYPFGFTQGDWHKTLISSTVQLESKRMDSGDPKTYVGKHCLDPDIEKEIEYSADLPPLDDNVPSPVA